jgi:uncharacterized membrane protein (DUF106 family)
MSFTNFLDPVFNPLLKLHPALAIFILALLITLISTIIYKYATDQKKLKKLKEELKDFQKKIKEAGKEDPGKALKIQQQAMQKNMEYFKLSFPSSLYTIIPALIIFIWLSTNLAYVAIHPSQDFTVTATFADGHTTFATLSAIPELQISGNVTQEIKNNVAIWSLKGQEGDYKLILDYNSEKYEQELLITSGNKYAAPEKLFENSKLKKMTIGNERIYPFTVPGINLKFNWFWAYFVMSIALSILIRKLMKVY